MIRNPAARVDSILTYSDPTFQLNRSRNGLDNLFAVCSSKNGFGIALKKKGSLEAIPKTFSSLTDGKKTKPAVVKAIPLHGPSGGDSLKKKDHTKYL
jgi:hypothetical protein